MNVRPADPRSHADSEFHFSEQPQLPEELRMLREQVRRFVEKEVVPHGEEWERDGKIPREIYRRMGALGFLGMRHAAEYGGTDMGPLASLVWADGWWVDRHSGRWPTWRRRHHRSRREIPRRVCMRRTARTKPGSNPGCASTFPVRHSAASPDHRRAMPVAQFACTIIPPNHCQITLDTRH